MVAAPRSKSPPPPEPTLVTRSGTNLCALASATVEHIGVLVDEAEYAVEDQLVLPQLHGGVGAQHLGLRASGLPR